MHHDRGPQHPAGGDRKAALRAVPVHAVTRSSRLSPALWLMPAPGRRRRDALLVGAESMAELIGRSCWTDRNSAAAFGAGVRAARG